MLRAHALGLLSLVLVACGGDDPPAATAPAAPEPEPAPTFTPAWTDTEMDAVLSRTMRLHLAPDLSALTEGERAAVTDLLAAGELIEEIYLDQRHPEAVAAATFLRSRVDMARQRDLFRVMGGPIATTLDNTRTPFLSVADERTERNVYPEGTTREAIETFLAAHPDRRDDLLDDRSVVWAATDERRAAALAALDTHPVLDTLHPGLRERIASDETYLSIPYSVAYAERILPISAHLFSAADHVEADDPAFARYLRLRARDLLADDYEGGDAAWVTSDFTGHLNAQIGSYETYDDPLFGVKTFFSLSLLVRDDARTDELRAGLTDIQAVEDALPHTPHRTVRSDIPVGVYEIIADFGQARGTNTASILPNEAYLSRQYGRTILMRGSILLSPEILAESARAFDAATALAHHGELAGAGNYDRTLWHEIGHYLGVDRTEDGRDLDVALTDAADLFEEMKADLVSLVANRMLFQAGHIEAPRLRAVYAAGIRRVLLKNRPRRAQPYQTMQLIQWNWFLDRGVLRLEDGALVIDYDRYDAAVTALLGEVLAIQFAGDHDRAEAFVTRWTEWREDLHEVIATRMREAERSRFSLVTYEALGEARR